MIGIYGGTFDPVHFGHLRTALDVQQALSLSQVRLVPCAQPAHRNQPQVSAAMRLQMLQLAVAGQTKLVVDDCELARTGPSYMVDTLQSIRAEVGDQAMVLIIGADAFNYLPSWYQWQRLFDYAHVLVMSRPGSSQVIESEQNFFQARLTDQLADLHNTSQGCLYFQVVTPLDFSSTQIRNMILARQSIRYCLPDPVIDFIYGHRLYRAN